MTGDRRQTRWRAVIRSDSTARLSPRGWRALQAYGVQTIVDLRDDSERRDAPSIELATVHVPLFDFAAAAFWDEWRGVRDTPRFYRALLDRWPDRFAAAIGAVARAPEGAVLIHCEDGRDRTGLVAALLLKLVGVPDETIAADYALSADRLRPRYDSLIAAADEDGKERLRQENFSDPATMLAVLEGFDVVGYLRRGGATAEDLAAVRTRLLDD
jgi:protein-tyrosine phosphatase